MGVLGCRIAFVFPGQGSQNIGMGKDFAENYPAAAEVFERADAALGYSISDICFNGPEDALNQTLNTQPALFTTSVAAFEAVKSCGLMPSMGAGHSVGEYAALYAAGAFSLEDGVKLIRTRAELMQEAAKNNPGEMAAILGASPDQVKDIVAKAQDSGIVVAANFNSPIQTVISGVPDAVRRASELALEAGAKRVIKLNVSGAFHSPLVQSAADAMLETLMNAKINDLTIPVVANYTADFENEAAEVRNNLAKQITGSVRWVESVEKMLDEKAEVFIELGAGNVLGGLIKRIAPNAEVYSVNDSASLAAIL